MNIQISVRRMPISLDMKKVINETCNDLSSKFNDIQTIEVYLEDINGPNKGGLDKCCHLKVRGPNHLSVDVTEIKRDLYSAIDKAFSRLVEIIKRKLSAKSFSSIGLLQSATSLPGEELA
jgi:ribosome-associated translation inhibitor RaiA